MTKIVYRPLGKSGLSVSAVGLGCMSLSGVYGAAEDAQSEKLIQHAIASGINHLDTSDMYGWGHNEEVVGRALEGVRRGSVVLATKFGQVRGEGGANAVNGRPEYVQAACDASLRRLGVEVIDLYYQHRVDPSVSVEDTVGAMSRLVDQGKVRFLGLSEARPERIRRAHAVHPITAVQTEYSLLYRTEAEETRQTTRELGIGFVAYSPLGRGFLTGTVAAADALPQNDARRGMPRFQGSNAQQNQKLVDALQELAASERCTPAQLCLAWLLSRRPPVVPLVGNSKRKWLEENAKATELRPSEATLAALDETFKPGVTQGDRYAAPMMARLGL
jgi:aryl-alcohol dehydrogenase-like predicted oxidoreductase